jgi:hypothetical protein
MAALRGFLFVYFAFIEMLAAPTNISLPGNILELEYVDGIEIFAYANSGLYSNMLLKEGHLYLTGIDYAFKLSSTNISDTRSTVSSYLRATNQQQQQQQQSHLNAVVNHIKYLGYRPSMSDFIICGTNMGKPHLYDLNKVNLSTIVEYDGYYLCAGRPDKASLGLISSGGFRVDQTRRRPSSSSTKQSIMHAAVWHAPPHSASPFALYGIYRQEVDKKRHFLRSMHSPHWLWSPEFIYAFDDHKYIYFFMNEILIEDFLSTNAPDELDRVRSEPEALEDEAWSATKHARVVRVCKNEKSGGGGGTQVPKGEQKYVNMWTTFRKIRMLCECEVTTGPTGLSLTTKLSRLVLAKKLDDEMNPAILGVFSAHDEKLSYLCEFDAKEMREALTRKKFWLNPHRKYSKTPMSLHENDIDCEHGLGAEHTRTTEAGSSTGSEDDVQLEYADELEEGSGGSGDENVGTDDQIEQTVKIYEFLAENTILDGTLAGHCVLIMPYNVSSISSHTADNQSTLYMGTTSGHLLHIQRRQSSPQRSAYELVASFNLAKVFAQSSAVAINEIVENREDNLLYLATNERVYQLNRAELNRLICHDQICSATKLSFSSETLNLTIRPHQTLILDCINEREFDRHEFKTLKSYWASRISWKRNEAPLCDLEHGESDNGDHEWHVSYHISRYGQLILLNASTNYSGIYECLLDEWRVLRRVHLSLNASQQTELEAASCHTTTPPPPSDQANQQVNSSVEWRIVDELSREFIEWKNHYYNYTETINKLLRSCVQD